MLVPDLREEAVSVPPLSGTAVTPVPRLRRCGLRVPRRGLGGGRHGAMRLERGR